MDRRVRYPHGSISGIFPNGQWRSHHLQDTGEHGEDLASFAADQQPLLISKECHLHFDKKYIYIYIFWNFLATHDIFLADLPPLAHFSEPMIVIVALSSLLILHSNGIALMNFHCCCSAALADQQVGRPQLHMIILYHYCGSITLLLVSSPCWSASNLGSVEWIDINYLVFNIMDNSQCSKKTKTNSFFDCVETLVL